MSRFRDYLESIGRFEPEKVRKPYDALLDGYLVWMRDYQHAAPGTLELRECSIRHFLEWLGEEATPDGLSGLTAEKVEEFFLSYAEGKGRSSRRSMQAALRTFLRSALYEDFIGQPLDGAVPILRTYKLASVPRGFSEEQAVRVMEAAPRDTAVGRRDYAILEMLYTYGVRGGQVRALCLKDVHWERNQILFRALKHGKNSLLPLTQSVGEALLEYLQKGRPKTGHREVFLTGRAPYRPLPNSNSLSAIVERRIRAAGIELASNGAHAFRHAFASRKLREGHSLKEIADVLGHRYLGTTFQYTKVDAPALEQVGLEWPEEAES
ncbi:MAG: site-specific integrase [Planctomycetota bacterium]|nr:site-specific integrase [Planctomycetota bacterium]